MRRLSPILLALAFLLPFLQPFFSFGESADARLPICCRSKGAHRCMTAGMAGKDAVATKPELSLVPERCPFCPGVPASFHLTGSAAAAGTSGISFLSHPASVAQVEARYRISFDRSRQKRGPPSMILSLS